MHRNNLIENAIKYGRNGGHIDVSACNLPDYAEITVSDDGIGIAECDPTHIFDRFYRVDSVRDRSGTGLGLSLSKEIAALHSGLLSTSSTLGKGSRFTLRLPRH